MPSTTLPSSMYGLRFTPGSGTNVIVLTVPGDVTCASLTFANVEPCLLLDTNTSTLSTKLQSPTGCAVAVIVSSSKFNVTLSIGPESIALIFAARSTFNGSGNSTARGPGNGEPVIRCSITG